MDDLAGTKVADISGASVAGRIGETTGRTEDIPRGIVMMVIAAVTPFYYLVLVWALLIGFVVWGDAPTVGLLAGSAIVVATGLFLFLREARMQRRLA